MSIPQAKLVSLITNRRSNAKRRTFAAWFRNFFQFPLGMPSTVEGRRHEPRLSRNFSSSFELLEARAMMAVLNELKVNPPGSATGADKYQYIELAGSVNESLANQYVVMFDGNGSTSGTAGYVSSLNGKTLGTSGFLMIKSPTGGHTAGTGTTVVTDAQFDNASGILSKTTVTFYLVSSTAPVVQGTDYDTNNDGVLDNLPTGFTVIDTVGWSDGDAGDKVYGNVTLTQTQGTPDAASRIVGNTSTATNAWFNGDLYDAGNDQTQLLYDYTRASSNLPIDPFIASLTPGAANFEASTTTRALRVVNYNVTSSANSGIPQTGMSTLLQAFGAEVVTNIARRIDLIAMQEVLSQATTGASVAGMLNTAYSTSSYVASTLNGGSTGSGTQGYVYNSQTLQLLGETAVGTANTSGQPRQTVRAKFRPVGTTGSSDFFVYNGHWKSADSTADEARRLVEAQAIRTDADALGQGANILYVGDFNIYRSTDNAFEALTAAGNGQAFDPINRIGSWHGNASFLSVLTQAPAVAPPNGLTGGGLDDRFDWQAVSGELLDGQGLDYYTGSYHTFGNNGSTPLNGDINNASSTALLGLANRTTVLNLLTSVADHLPVVADYTYTVAATNNSAPSGADKTVSTNEDTSYTFTTSDFGFIDSGNTPANTLLAVKVSTLPTAGSLLLNNSAVSAGQFIAVTDIAAGNLKFAPASNANGTPYATWTFQVQDNGGTASGGVDLDPTPNTMTMNVAAVNDAPSVTTSSGSTVGAGLTAVPVDQGVSIADVDSSNLVGATVSITGNLSSAQDFLGFTNANGIIGSYNTTTGVLTLSGSASVANYQLAFRSVVYNNLSANPNTATRTVSFQVNDGSSANNLSNIATRSITITVNTAPVVTASTGSSAFSGTAVVVDSGITVTDADSANLNAATVSISTGFLGTEDSLAFVNANGISGAYNSSTGVLSLSGASSVANYQAALRSVTYNNTNSNPNTTTRSLSFSVNDGSATNSLSNVATKSLTVTPANAAPLSIQTFAQNPSGVDIAFSRPVNVAAINLYDQGTTLGAPDVTLVGATTGPVRGSLIFNATNTGFTFIKTGSITTGTGSGAVPGTLAPDTYTLTLRSNATDGFSDLAGNALRNFAGTAAGDYIRAFTVAAPAAGTITVSIPDFARGYSQPVNVPNTSAGLPVVLSTANNVSVVDFSITYDPTLLSITGFTATDTTVSAVVNVSVPGVASVSIVSNTALATVDGVYVLGTFAATVLPTAPYGSKQIIKFTNIDINDASANASTIPSLADNAVHVAAFFGDTSGNQSFGGNDALLIQRAVVGTNSGFTAFQLADPYIVGDTSMNLGFGGNDALFVQRAVVGTAVPNIPALPSGITPPSPGGPDPRMFIPRDLVAVDVDAATAGVQIDIPIRLLVTEAAGITIADVDFQLDYDPAKLTITTAGIVAGDLLTGSNLINSAFSGAATVTNGRISLSQLSNDGTVLFPFNKTGDLYRIRATIVAGATGTTILNLRGTGTAIFDNNVDQLTLVPAPTDVNTDAVDGLLTISAVSNGAPTDIGLSPSTIAENAGANATVGTLSTVDPDSGDTFTYSLVTGTGSTDNAAFNISSSTLRATASLDFEAKSSYTVRVRTTDAGGLFFEKAFTINVTNVNEAPTDIALTSATIPENGGANATVGTLSTTDPDAANTFTYSLVAGTGSTDNAAFNISGTSLRATSNLDFETKNSYSVRVRTTDQGGLTFEKIITISVTNVNEAPTDIALSSTSIAENAGANATVGTLSTVDPDVANTFTYALVAGTGSTDNAAFAVAGNVLTANASFDFETKTSYSIRVRTTDQGGLTFEKVFTISITNVNEAPTDILLSSASIAENGGANAAVGTLSSVDPDAANTFTYTLVTGTGSTDNAAFNISGTSLRATANLDFETKSSYSVRVRTTDQGGLTFEKVFTISVTNVNEAPTDIALSSTSIAENAGANATVGTLSTVDPDAANTFTYTLVAGTGSTDNVAFNISGALLRATASLDFETKSSYSVRIRTTDQGGLTFEKVFTISVTNVNEAPTDIGLSATTIPENGAANATVGTFSTTDPDAANTFTYTLATGTGSTDNAAFNINGTALRANAILDFETQSSYSVRVRTTDQGGLTFEKVFTISVSNIAEAQMSVPTDLTSSVDVDPATAGVQVDIPIRLLVNEAAGITIADVDFQLDYDPAKLTIVSTGITVGALLSGANLVSSAFSGPISVNAGRISLSQLSNEGTVLFPRNTAGELYRIRATVVNGATGTTRLNLRGTGTAIFDNNVAQLTLNPTPTDGTTDTVDGQLTIVASNNPPTDVSLSATTIAENAGVNAVVGTLSTTDPDSGNAFTYSLVTGTGSTDNAAFNVSGNTLRANASFDFETKNSYSVRIRTTDQGGLTFEKVFPISVTNINESVVLTRANASVSGNVATQLTNTGTWFDPESGEVTLSATVGTVTKNVDGTWSWSYQPTNAFSGQVITITATDGTNNSTTTFSATAFSVLATRGLSYLRATGASASTTLATDKTALLPGQTSTYANYTNYSRGLNGVVIDVVGLPATVTNAQLAASLQFANWDGIAAAGFAALPGAAVPTVAIVAGGVAGSKRVQIEFPDNTLQNTWLRVTVIANSNTGLAANDVFYFGNVIGDLNVGNTASRIQVDATDVNAVRLNQSTLPNTVGVTNIYDLNRDGRVNATDTGIVRSNQQTLGIVAPITAPSQASRTSSQASRTSSQQNRSSSAPEDGNNVAPAPSLLSSTSSWQVGNQIVEDHVLRACVAVSVLNDTNFAPKTVQQNDASTWNDEFKRKEKTKEQTTANIVDAYFADLWERL